MFPDFSTQAAGENKLSSKVKMAVFSVLRNICYRENEVSHTRIGAWVPCRLFQLHRVCRVELDRIVILKTCITGRLVDVRSWCLSTTILEVCR